MQTTSAGRLPLLVVLDDNPGDFLLFETYLTAEAPGEYRLIHAPRYADFERLASAGENVPDLVLIDCGIDGGRGIEYVRAVARAYPACAVIGLAERQDGDDARACREAGAVNLVAKDQVTAAGFAHVLAFAASNQRRMHTLFESAYYDALTGLANRNLLGDRIHHAIDRARRSSEYVALLMIDLDDFKQVNDGFGHDVGDEYLVAVADALRATVRESDTVARLGGDEFAVLLEGLRHAEMATSIASKITALAEQPFNLRGKLLFPGMSVGVSLFSPESSRFTSEWLMKSADTALYQAKELGKNRYCVFTTALDQEMVDNLSLDREIRQALARQELNVHYQPIVDPESGSVVAVEALLRWQHPSRGMLEPAYFLPAIEKLGFMREVGDFVLHQALRDLARLRATFGVPLAMHVNVSAGQVAGRGFGGAVERALARHGVDAAALCLEFSEAVLFDCTEATSRELAELRRLGVRLAIDDFGTAYGSYSALRHFEVDSIKINQRFINQLGGDPVVRAIVRSIVGLAHELDVAVTAEGVENLEQLRQFDTLGTATMQGFLFYRPLPVARLVEMAGGSAAAGKPGALSAAGGPIRKLTRLEAVPAPAKTARPPSALQ